MSNVNRIQIIPSQINKPSTQGGTTLTGTYANLPYNKNAIKRLQAIVGDNFEGDLNIFDNEEGSFNILPLDKLQQLLTNVLIRFDNNPNYYTKSDYQHLIWYLCQSLGYFVSKDVSSDVINLQEQIKDLEQRVDNKQDKVKRVHKTYEELESYVLAYNNPSIVGSILVVTEGDSKGAYIVKSADYTGNPAKVEISSISNGKSTLIISEEVDPDIAYIKDGKLFIADMRSRWETNF